MTSIAEINNPIEKFVAFISEREAIRVRRFVMKKSWPWTKDPILQEYRFTNVHREDDAVSQHYQRTIRNRYSDDSYILPATVLYRWFNRISTCDALFNEPDLGNHSVFENYMKTGDFAFLDNCLNKLPPPHVTGSFIITGKPGFPKSLGVLIYFEEWCKKPWPELYEVWKKHPPLLSEMYAQLNSEGLGSFMRGQLIADLKYLPFMLGVDDWWTWATPGPGSMRGLNIILERPMNESWPKGMWLDELKRLSNIVTPMLKGFGMERLHNQDLQNCLCEWSKYTKVARGEGRPRQVFKNKEPIDV
jgi:hypothetical protein